MDLGAASRYVRGVSAATWLGVAAAVASTPDPGVLERSVGDTETVALVSLAPREVESAHSPSAVLRAADTALARDTSLRAASGESSGVDPSALRACAPAERLACWTRVATRAAPAPRFLLAIGALPVASGVDQISAIWLDVTAAAAALDAGDTAGLLAATRTFGAREVSARDPDALGVWFGELLAELSDGLARTGHWRPFGRVRLEAAPAELALELDGRPVAVTDGRPVVLAGVRAGSRSLALRSGDVIRWTERVEVLAGATTTIEASTAARAHALRAPLRWGGLGVAAVGIGVAVAGLASGGGRDSLCVVRPGSSADDCPSGAGPRLGAGALEGPSTDPADVTGAGVPALPIAAALLGAGATWAIGASLGEPRDAPWWAIVVGAAVGGAALGLGLALDGG